MHAVDFQNDDTKARILSLEQEIIKEKGERTGIFTTAILSTLESGIRIGLFFTGRKHAGENLDALLDDRPEEQPPPIQLLLVKIDYHVEMVRFYEKVSIKHTSLSTNEQDVQAFFQAMDSNIGIFDGR